jgi:L-fuconolactonase
MIIDSHMHVWALARGDYGWLTPDLAPLYSDYAIDDVWPDASAGGVSQVILVQAAPTAAETDFLLTLAAGDTRVAGVVGWVDLEAEAAPREIKRRAENSKVIGLRPMLPDLPDPDWILRDTVAPALTAMAEAGLVLDGLAEPRHLPVLTELARRFPKLHIILDHAGKPPIAGGDLSSWAADLDAFAAAPNTACKFSGLLTSAGPHTDDDSLAAAVSAMVHSFGPSRILWGGDWPFMRLNGEYAPWLAQSRRLADRLMGARQDPIWADTARRIYKLETP